MRFLALLGKFNRESLREWSILVLALSFAPLFVLIFHFALAGNPMTFKLVLVDEGRASASIQAGAPGLSVPLFSNRCGPTISATPP